jgi:hypothetical protein
MSNSSILILVGVAVAIVIWRFIYRRLVPERGVRLTVQAVACGLVVSLVAIQSYVRHTPLSFLDAGMIIIGVIAAFDSLWKRQGLVLNRPT